MANHLTYHELYNIEKRKVAEQELNIEFLNKQMDKHLIDVVANFGAWLVDNHECRFMGGEIEIAELCSEFVEQLEKAN